MPAVARKKGDPPRRYHDREGRPYKLDRGHTAVTKGGRTSIVRDREPERIEPIKRSYSFADRIVFDHAVGLLVTDPAAAADLRRRFEEERRARRLSHEAGIALIAGTVAALRGLPVDEACALVLARAERLLRKSEMAARPEDERGGGRPGGRRGVVRSLRHHRRFD